jgi:hypothetical protein
LWVIVIDFYYEWLFYLSYACMIVKKSTIFSISDISGDSENLYLGTFKEANNSYLRTLRGLPNHLINTEPRAYEYFSKLTLRNLKIHVYLMKKNSTHENSSYKHISKNTLCT